MISAGRNSQNVDAKSCFAVIFSATAIVNGMSVVTRNVADYQGTGVALIDPWVS
jgi:hypothetical protein